MNAQGPTGPGTNPTVVLDPVVVRFVADGSEGATRHDGPPDPASGREALERLQGHAVPRPPADERWIAVPVAGGREVPVRVVRPPDTTGALPVVLFLHGGGWVFGSARTHDRLVRELATRSRAAVVVPEYSRAPEARYPVALEESLDVVRWIRRTGAAHGLDGERLAVAGDSAGGNLAAALTLLLGGEPGPRPRALALFYPSPTRPRRLRRSRRSRTVRA